MYIQITELFVVFCFLESFLTASGLGYSESSEDKSGNRVAKDFNSIRVIKIVDFSLG